MVAEVDVELVEAVGGWAPYLSLDDAYRLAPSRGNRRWLLLTEVESTSAHLSPMRSCSRRLSPIVDLLDGRTITVPLAWYPRLAHGGKTERAHWRFVGDGEGIHWTDLDEDISVEGLLAGRRSGETQASLRRWLDGRHAR